MIKSNIYEWNNLNHSQKLDYVLKNSKPELSKEIDYAVYTYKNVKRSKKINYCLIIGGVILGILTKNVSATLYLTGIISSIAGTCKYTGDLIEKDDLEYALDGIKEKL
ncbi:MAG: hypothetical protein PHN56_03205 [Candidatus Nanoarchaeia archaeon]|nr:hypothetical protein [Candidatus Nanoarchaeia archaeon]